METIEKNIEIAVPVHVAYNQWTQFEEFPAFMEGVKEVRQINDKRLYWRAEILGKEKEWEAEIFEQIPDRRISWRSLAGVRMAGTVFFEPLDDETTRISLSISYEPKGVAENIADKLGAVSLRIEGDLQRFKEFMDERQMETGQWRGTIRSGTIDKGNT